MVLKVQNDITQNNLGRGIVNLKKGQTISAANSAFFQSIATMDARLKTAGYTDATLNAMTKNDKVFALRKVLALSAP